MTSRFFNPLLLWTDVAAQTGAMLLSSSTVIQIRTDRLLRDALSPGQADVQEIGLMGQEKLQAASESGAAMANHLHTVHFALPQRAVRLSFQSAEAMAQLFAAISPAEVATRLQRLLNISNRSVATVSQLCSASARIAQRGLRPVQERAASNARRLLATQALPVSSPARGEEA